MVRFVCGRIGFFMPIAVAPSKMLFSKTYGGEGGIRTHGTVTGTTVFETALLKNHMHPRSLGAEVFRKGLAPIGLGKAQH